MTEGATEYLISLSEAESGELKEVDLSDNDLEEIDSSLWTRLSSLELLDLSFNRLKKIEFGSSLHKLKELNLSHNQLTDLEGIISSLMALKILDLSHNQIAFIHPSNFPPKLRHLSLHHNPIADTEGYTEVIVAALPLLCGLDSKPLAPPEPSFPGPSATSKTLLECECYALNRVVQKQEAEIRRLQSTCDHQPDPSSIGWKEETFKLLVQRRALELKAAEEIVELRSQLDACKTKLKKRGYPHHDPPPNTDSAFLDTLRESLYPNRLAAALEKSMIPAEEKLRKLGERISFLSTRTSWALQHPVPAKTTTLSSPCCPHLTREITKLSDERNMITEELETAEHRLQDVTAKLEQAEATVNHLEDVLADKNELLERTTSELEKEEELRIAAESDAAAKSAVLEAMNQQSQDLVEMGGRAAEGPDWIAQELWGLERITSEILKGSPEELSRGN